jgi:hemin uptake protein HemP
MADRPLASKWNDSKGARRSPGSHGEEKASLPRYKVSELLGSASEAILEHGGGEYRLRITANRKLILTK